MALIKVLIIFVVILALLNKSLPLYLAMIFGSLLMIVMFRLPLATAGQTALHRSEEHTSELHHEIPSRMPSSA